MSLNAMKQALRALENPWEAGAEGVADAIIALRAAIEQPRQWQGLTDDEREQFRRWAHPDMIEAIELRLQERNT
jgi:murein endopeptidase